MFRAPLLLLLFFFVVACGINDAPVESQGLTVSIDIDDKSKTNIRQIVFSFSADIAITGAIPSQTLLAHFAIKQLLLGEQIQPQCRWRFLDTKRLACELAKPLNEASLFEISASQGIVALNGKSLNTRKQLKLKTPFPRWGFSYDQNRLGHIQTDFSTFLPTGSKQLPWDEDTLVKHLKLKTPQGELLDLDVSYTLNDSFVSLKATAKQAPPQWLDGQYHLVLTKGFTIIAGSYPLEQQLSLSSFWYFEAFKWLGLACVLPEGLNYDPERIVRPNAQGVIDCDPEHLVLQFSRRVDSTQLQTAIKGNEYTPAYRRAVRGVFFLPISLRGERKYTFDLNSITDLKGNLLSNPESISFTTAKSKPYWSLLEQKVALSEADLEPESPFWARNVFSVDGEFNPINQVNDLQLWLNHQGPEARKKSWSLNYSRPSDLESHSIPYQQMLTQASGLVETKIKALDSTHRVLFNRASFGLSFWQAKDLLVFASDWQNAKPLSQVGLSLACPGFAEPKALGQTDNDGVLQVDRQRVRSWLSEVDSVTAQQCWLWGQNDQGSSAVKLELTANPSTGQSIKMWSAQPVYQPGDTIHLGILGRKRGTDGIVPITDWQGGRLTLERGWDGKDKLAVELPPWSDMGMAGIKLATDKDWKPGRYHLKYTAEDQPVYASVLGSFELEFYTPPEYEVQVRVPESIYGVGEHRVDIQAMRLNGVPLAAAKADIQLSLHSSTSYFSQLAQEFRLITPYKNYQNIKLDGHNSQLDQNGKTGYQSLIDKPEIGMGQVHTQVVITAKDGEVQSHQRLSHYLPWAHYFVYKLIDDRSAIEIRAIDRQHNFVEGVEINTTLIAKYKSGGARRLDCALTTVPGICALPTNHQGWFELTVESSHQGKKYHSTQQLWNRAFHEQHQSRSAKFKWQHHEQVVKPGQQAELILHSSYQGMAMMMIAADGIVKHWLQPIVKGDNQVSIPVERGWMPSATVSVALPLPRGEIYSRYRHKLEQASTELLIHSAQPKLDLITELPRANWLSGQTVIMALKSNMSTQTRSWLVNEALWQLLGTQSADFDMNKALSINVSQKNHGDWGAVGFTSLFEQLLRDRPKPRAENPYSMDVFSSARKLRGMEMGDAPAQVQAMSTANFAQSIWLDSLQLQPQQSQSLSFTLPKIPGRYKLVTIGAGIEQMDWDVQTITTHLPEEYFIDAPKISYLGDQPQLLLTAINRSGKAIKPQLTVKIDGKLWQPLGLSLAVDDQQTHSYSLPPLAVGIHEIELHHPELGLLAAHQLEIKTNLTAHQRSWLYQPEQTPQLSLPPQYQQGSIHLSQLTAQSSAPHWSGLSEFNQNYDHQCWEQNISRLLSYVYTPAQQQLWPQGEGYFERLFADIEPYQQQQKFSFFPDGPGDDFLTAYTHLVNSWLKLRSRQLNIDQSSLDQQVLELLKNNELPVLVRSMALAAAAQGQLLTTEQVLDYRQQIGTGSGFAQILQLLGLKQLDSPKALIEQSIEALIRSGYQDTSLSLLNGNAERCFAGLAIGEQHPQAQHLINEVIGSQRDQGFFGSTFANGVCSYLLHQRVGHDDDNVPLKFEQTGQQVRFAHSSNQPYWLKLDYQQSFAQTNRVAQGIKLQRRYYLKTSHNHGDWRLLSATDELAIGDIVKVELVIDSPIYRDHLVLVDPTPGAFEVINDKFAHQVRNNPHGYERSWLSHHKVIKADAVVYYPYFIVKGENQFDYLLKVRHGGRFVAPPATVEHMYQTQVRANSDMQSIKVKTQ